MVGKIDLMPICYNESCHMYAQISEYGIYGSLYNLNGSRIHGLSNNVSWTFEDIDKLIRVESVSCNGCGNIRAASCDGALLGDADVQR